MNIIFTGSSSFTGYWFAKKLIGEGNNVYCTLTGKDISEYNEVKKQRIQQLDKKCTFVDGCRFGSEKFYNLINEIGKVDILCHHGAEVENYKSIDFNIPGALSNNTSGLNKTLDILKKNGCEKIILTGSVFEPYEGAGSDGLMSFSPYGLSKYFTFEIFKYFTERLDIKLGKFTIPNPFGPYEEERFCAYLIKNWAENKTPSVNTPLYVRDNIPVNVLADSYLLFLRQINDSPDLVNRYNPSGYIESMGDFTRRLSFEFRERLGLECNYQLNKQTNFDEPMIRINTDSVFTRVNSWNESDFWGKYAGYYKTKLKIGE
jgi:nucleoside-diphosphate-sugar epimerase